MCLTSLCCFISPGNYAEWLKSLYKGAKKIHFYQFLYIFFNICVFILIYWGIFYWSSNKIKCYVTCLVFSLVIFFESWWGETSRHGRWRLSFVCGEVSDARARRWQQKSRVRGRRGRLWCPGRCSLTTQRFLLWHHCSSHSWWCQNFKIHSDHVLIHYNGVTMLFWIWLCCF